MGQRWIVIGLLVLGACGSAEPRAEPKAAASPSEEAPASLKVICHEDGSTELLNNAAQAQSDGVHIQVDNRAGEFASLNGTGLDFSEGTTEQVARVQPGELKIACWPGSMHTGTEPKLLSVEVLDPHDYWTPAELECPSGDLVGSAINDYFSDSGGEKGDPEDIARAKIKGIRDTDVVKTVGYPDAEYREVAVERNEDVIAILSFSPASNGGWLFSGYSACDSARIRG